MLDRDFKVLNPIHDIQQIFNVIALTNQWLNKAYNIMVLSHFPQSTNKLAHVIPAPDFK